MTINDWVDMSTKKLESAQADSPRSDIFAILEDITSKEKVWLIAHPEYLLPEPTLQKLNRLIERRVKREPLAYILKRKEFYGRDFVVTPEVLIPRPESENFIDLLKEIRPKTVLDIGTGSGCLAITAKLELLKTELVAIDIDQAALKIAQLNAQKYQVHIKFLQGSLLEPLASFGFSETTIIANLPYVPDGLITSPEIGTEPSLALFAGKDGLNTYKKFWQEVGALPQKPQNILVESLTDQHFKLQKLASNAGYQLKETKDLVQLFQIN